jgi:hypothetical protein
MTVLEKEWFCVPLVLLLVVRPHVLASRHVSLLKFPLPPKFGVVYYAGCSRISSGIFKMHVVVCDDT